MLAIRTCQFIIVGNNENMSEMCVQFLSFCPSLFILFQQCSLSNKNIYINLFFYLYCISKQLPPFF